MHAMDITTTSIQNVTNEVTWDRDAHINFKEKLKMETIDELTSKNSGQTEGFEDRRPEWDSHDNVCIVDTSTIKTKETNSI